jgi:hypothetical protein
MKSLTERPLEERLADDEIIKRAVEAGAVKNGYIVMYLLESVAHIFRSLDSHIIVEFMVNGSSRYGRGAIRIFENGEEEEAKKFCYTETLEYIKENCHVKSGKIWPNSGMPAREEYCNFTNGAIVPIVRSISHL